MLELADLGAAQDAVLALLRRLGPDDWDRPTPCEDWDVAGVARHLIVGERAFTTSLGGSGYELAALVVEVGALPTDALPDAYAQSSERLRAGVAGEPSGEFPTGLGPMTAPAIARLRTIEALAHGWDLARAVRTSLEVPDDVAERAHAHSLVLMDRLPPGRTPFAPPRPVPEGAAPIDRLAGLLGRAVE